MKVKKSNLFFVLFFISFFVGPLYAQELGSGQSSRQERRSHSGTAQRYADSNECTAEEVSENRKIINECNASWDKWGIEKPSANELRDPNNCSGLVSMGTLQGCGDMLVSFPIFMGEMGARAMLSTIPVDKNTRAYVSQNGSQQEIAAFLTHEFMRDTCGLAEIDEDDYIHQRCELSTGTNSHLASNSASSNCREAGLKELQRARECRKSSETRRKYRSQSSALMEEAREIKRIQDENRATEERFQRDIASIKDSCGIYMNPLKGSVLRYLSPMSYLGKEIQNIVRPNESQVQQFNDCVERKTRGKKELREALVKQSGGLMGQISASFSALKCYNERERKAMMCEIAAGVVTGGGALTASLAKRLGQKGVRQYQKFIGRGEHTPGVVSDQVASVRAGRASQSQLQSNAQLNNIERAQKAGQRLYGQGGQLTDRQRNGLIAAHNVGADRAGAGIGNYTQAEIAEKTRILKEAGFDANERRVLLDEGYAGRLGETIVANESIDELTIGSLASRYEREMSRDQRRFERSPYTGATWQREPEVRGRIASDVREHLDNGGVLQRDIQRGELLRVIALDTEQSTRNGLKPNYENLERYYNKAGVEVDDGFVSYLTQGIRVDSNPPPFMLEAQIAESRMAIDSLRRRAALYSDEMRARGMDMTPAEGRAQARQYQEQIREIEKAMNIRQTLLDSQQ